MLLPHPLNDEPLLLLSPHCDDAVLSCAALLARERPIDLMTVFTGAPDPPQQSAWDRTTGFANSAASVPVRRAEEEAALASTPHTLTFLDLIEAEYLDGPRRPADRATLTAAVEAWLDRHPGGIVVAPAGAGSSAGRVRTRARRLLGRASRTRHPDHVFVRETALELALSSPGLRVVLYEELPYSWDEAADKEVRRLVLRRRAVATLVTVPVDTRAKAARIAVYESQTPHLVVAGRRVDFADDLPREERYWTLEK
jgi:LmbE family N-acetylglucosaminyl deacetylase